MFSRTNLNTQYAVTYIRMTFYHTETITRLLTEIVRQSYAVKGKNSSPEGGTKLVDVVFSYVARESSQYSCDVPVCRPRHMYTLVYCKNGCIGQKKQIKFKRWVVGAMMASADVRIIYENQH